MTTGLNVMQQPDPLEHLGQSVASICKQLGIVLTARSLEHHSINRQNLLVTLQLLVHLYGPSHPEPFMPLLVDVAHMLNDKMSAVRGSAMATLAGMVKGMKESALSSMPQVILCCIVYLLFEPAQEEH